MKISKKAFGVAMSVVMLGSQVMPVLADTDPTNGGTTGGTANILDYAVESVVVPTALKITLNPKGYSITTKYVKADSYTANTVYYTEAGGIYTKAAVADASAFGSGGPYYTAAASTTDQVVSLNYGVANKSTSAKTVKVDFAATYNATDGKKAIEFVDSEAKARAYNVDSNIGGAKAGEHKMYLAVASADALPTANTYIKTTDSTVDSGKTYYTKSGSAYTKVDSPADASIGTYYEATNVIGTEITAEELSDITMTKATAGNQVFAKGTTNKADASIAYSLGKATYAVKNGETIDFGTTQTDLANKLEMSALGGVAGFTLTGVVNTDADWTKADAAAITITPTYTITDVTGTEAAVDSGAYNQVNLGPTLAQTSHTVDSSNSAITITVNNLGDETIASVINTDGNANLVSSRFATIDGATVTITSTYVGYFASGYSTTIKITTSGGKELLFAITKP